MEAVALKNYAISKGNSVSEAILKILNEAERTYQNGKDLSDYGIDIDKSISELTAATYPTTGESLLLTQAPPASVRNFRYALPILLVVALGGAIWGYSGGTQPVPLSVLAMSLGLLGAVVNQIFNIIGVLKERAFSIEDVYANILRILLGPAIGWVFYYGFVRETNTGTNGTQAPQNSLVLLLLPFFAGFSTKLVVGIMDKTIQSIMLIFGIEDKRTDILVRQRRHQETATAVPPGGDKSPGDKSSESKGRSDNPPPTVERKPMP
jgi:hypothetical protein